MTYFTSTDVMTVICLYHKELFDSFRINCDKIESTQIGIALKRWRLICHSRGANHESEYTVFFLFARGFCKLKPEIDILIQ